MIVTCPKCSQIVETETLVGRRRRVTTTSIHISEGKICYSILKTQETR
jgi:hypothetical protein